MASITTWTVTHPTTGKRYTYNDKRRASALARKLGVDTLSVGTKRVRSTDDGYDARRDAMAERGTLRASRYVR